MTNEVRLLAEDDAGLVERCPPGVFDDPVDLRRAREFLSDPRHLLAAAIVDGAIAGMATGVIYVHPDKARPELWINEVGVTDDKQRRGLGQAVMGALLKAARDAGCSEAWVLTAKSNDAARRLYAACGGLEDGSESVMIEFTLDGGA